MGKEIKGIIKFTAIALIIGILLGIGNTMLIDSGYFDASIKYDLLRGY